jgi:hypothetical protein
MAGTGNRDDTTFVIRVMSSYHGETFLNETCRAVVRALPGGDPLQGEVEVVLQSTGIVSGTGPALDEGYSRSEKADQGVQRRAPRLKRTSLHEQRRLARAIRQTVEA